MKCRPTFVCKMHVTQPCWDYFSHCFVQPCMNGKMNNRLTIINSDRQNVRTMCYGLSFCVLKCYTFEITDSRLSICCMSLSQNRIACKSFQSFVEYMNNRRNCRPIKMSKLKTKWNDFEYFLYKSNTDTFSQRFVEMLFILCAWRQWWFWLNLSKSVDCCL